MIKNIYLLLLILFSVSVQAGNIKESSVPAPVKNYVKTNYQDANHIKWDYEDDDNFYEAEFKINGLEYELEISPEGKLLYCKQEIPIESIPASIKNNLNKNYPGYNILGAKKITKGNSIKYDVGIVGKNSFGNTRHKNIYFNGEN